MGNDCYHLIEAHVQQYSGKCEMQKEGVKE